MQSVDPATALREIAEAVPRDCRDKIIVIGSLAVGYHYRDQLMNMGVRTKDADCLLSPRVEAIPAGVAIADRLFDAKWTFKGATKWAYMSTVEGPMLPIVLQIADMEKDGTITVQRTLDNFPLLSGTVTSTAPTSAQKVPTADALTDLF